MKLKFDFNYMMRESVGKHGIVSAAIEKDAKHHEQALNSVVAQSGKGWQEWTELPRAKEDEINEVIAYGDEIRKKADSFVVLGIGGSALGPMCVAQALLHLHHNELPKQKRNAPKLYIEDNVDPERMAALLDVLDLKTSYFNVITKSGETSETLSQFILLYEALKEAVGDEALSHIVVTTTIGKGALYNTANKLGCKIFGVGAGVGGRFSVLSNVGLVPFAVMGFDIKAMLKGANEMRIASEKSDIMQNPALLSAYLQVSAMKKGMNISVMMPYADSLKYMADFYCQIWAESLGKAVNLSGKTVNAGQTPAKALGVTDQHSQVQLYTEGPFDKVVTFIAVENFRNSVTIPQSDDIDLGDFLKTHTFNELIDCERKATEFALAKAGRPNFTIILPEVNAETVGELLMYYMYQTAFAGAYLNVDTFNQPGVEEGKKATFAMLNRHGYETKLQEYNEKTNASKTDKFIIQD